MPDIFIDCEWIPGDYITILGAYCSCKDRFQLYDKSLTKTNFIDFIEGCKGRRTEPFLFCHGPDIGRIERYFNLDLKKKYPCVNVQKAFRQFTRFNKVGIYHLERKFGIPRGWVMSWEDMELYWKIRKEYRKHVLDYNWDDCVNLSRLVTVLKRQYGVTRGDFQSIAM